MLTADRSTNSDPHAARSLRAEVRYHRIDTPSGGLKRDNLLRRILIMKAVAPSNALDPG